MINFIQGIAATLVVLIFTVMAICLIPGVAPNPQASRAFRKAKRDKSVEPFAQALDGTILWVTVGINGEPVYFTGAKPQSPQHCDRLV